MLGLREIALLNGDEHQGGVARMVGAFKRVQRSDPHLARYVDISSARNGHVLLVSEGGNESLADLLRAEGPFSEERIAAVLADIVSAVLKLHRAGIVARNLSLDSVLWSDSGAKVADYGLFELSQCGKIVPFAIGDPEYLSPEAVATGPRGKITRKCDIWAIGIIAVALLVGELPFAGAKEPLSILTKVIALRSAEVVQNFLAELGDKWKFSSQSFKSFVLRCLDPSPRSRACAAELLQHPFVSAHTKKITMASFSVYESKPVLKCLQPPRTEEEHVEHFQDVERSFQFWKSAGGDVRSAFARELNLSTPILSIPTVVKGYFTGKDDLLFASKIASVPCQDLWKRSPQNAQKDNVFMENPLDISKAARDVSLFGEKYQELVRKQYSLSSMEYQRVRIDIFEELLRLYDTGDSAFVTREDIRKEMAEQASGGIPGIFRGKAWLALLEFDSREASEMLSANTKVNMSPEAQKISHQIDLDIVRCHQYNELLASPEGHSKFKRVIQCWLEANPHLSYWQGLDSVLAPFIALGFTDAQCLWCLNRFVSKNLRGLYAIDNSQYINSRLVMFMHLLAFYDPELANHLKEIDFSPSLYAIPWFLTAFAHFFPLEKIYAIWDYALVCQNFVLFFAVEILLSIREELLGATFDGAIILFSSGLASLDVHLLAVSAYKRATTCPLKASVEFFVNVQENPVGEWWKVPASPDVLIAERTPRIVFRDFDAICEDAAIIDVRVPEEYNHHHHPLALNFPLSRVSKKDITPFREQVIIIIGEGQSDLKSCATLASKLVQLGFERVCILNGGMECLQDEMLLKLVPS